MWHPVPCTDQTADVTINKTALNHSVWPSIDILTGKTLQKRQTALFPLLILTLFVHNSTATVLRLKLALSQQYINNHLAHHKNCVHLRLPWFKSTLGTNPSTELYSTKPNLIKSKPTDAQAYGESTVKCVMSPEVWSGHSLVTLSLSARFDV